MTYVRSLLYLCIALPFVAVSACSVFTVPETLEQKAYALYSSFVIVEETAADVVENPATPDGVVAVIQETDLIAKPLADTLAVAARRYTAAREAVEAAAGDAGLQAAATTALAELKLAYDEAKPAIDALIAAITAHREATIEAMTKAVETHNLASAE